MPLNLQVRDSSRFVTPKNSFSLLRRDAPNKRCHRLHFVWQWLSKPYPIQDYYYMAVRLRIAGIFYDQEFEYNTLTPVPAFTIPDRNVPLNPATNPIPDIAIGAPVPTIFELFEAARRAPGVDKENFIYVFERRDGALSMTSIGVNHKVPFRSLGEKERNAGPYQLTEIAIPFGVVAWQYYVYRNGISVSKQNPNTMEGYSGAKGLTPLGTTVPHGSGFTGFDQFVLRDGDEVIYRQIAILREPNGPVKFGPLAAKTAS